MSALGVVADTHALIWYVDSPADLPAGATNSLDNAAMEWQPLFTVSVASIASGHRVALKSYRGAEAAINRRIRLMVATMNPPEQAAQTVILRNVSWSLYQQLLAEHQDVVNPRFAYDRGTLEIKMASFEHEQINRLLADIFGLLADELETDFIDAGSTTFDREDLEQGFEPDTCFYIEHVEAVRGQSQIDLRHDPPPDLVIEIDITHPSLNKFPIFAGLGIPETWRYHKGQLTIFHLEGSEYREQPVSRAFPGVTGERLTQLIAASRQLKRTDWLREVRDWAHTLKTQGTA